MKTWGFLCILVFTLFNLLPIVEWTPKALATNHQVRINQVMTGANGNTSVQFIELEMCCPGENLWGPQAKETASRARLVFYGASGSQTGVFDFPSDPPSGNLSVLIATQAFADLPGAPTPDFILPAGLLQPTGGKVVFAANPDNAAAIAVTLALSYGGFTGDTEGAGSPAPGLPVTGAKSLSRQTAFRSGSFFGSASNSNSHFAEADAAPRNAAGQTGPMSFFPDIAATDCAPFAQVVVNAGIMAGCADGNFCPDTAITRGELARLLLRGRYGTAYTPPPATGTVFLDVPASQAFGAWIEQIWAEGIMEGCGPGQFCPDATVSRAAMAVFLLRTKHGSPYTPPPATIPVFADVAIADGFAPWIHQLAAEGITTGCSCGNFCPSTVVTRAVMATFFVRTFNLPLPPGSLTGGCEVTPLTVSPLGDQSVCAGAMATFTATLTGPEAFTATWKKGATILTNGALNGRVSITVTGGSVTLSISNVEPSDADTYTLDAANTCGSQSASRSATLTVNVAPSVNIHPNSQAVCPDATVSFMAAASGTPVPVTQWQRSTDGGKTFQDIQGEVSATLQIIATPAQHNQQFRARFTNSCGEAFSNGAVLSVDQLAPVLACPTNITTSTAADQCSAIVTFSATASDNCAGSVTPMCTPASGSTFPKGATTVTCTATDGGGNSATCSFTVTVNDTQPPSIVCPPNQTRITAQPGGSSVVVTYAPPQSSDICGASVVCNPPSGATFARGVTTVTCTATDTAGNSSGCSFTVTVFDLCLQDDTTPGSTLLWNSQTGDYRYCCAGVSYAGRGASTRKGGVYTLSQMSGAQRVTASVDSSANRGTATLQVGSANGCPITDRDIRNNTCQCASGNP